MSETGAMGCNFCIAKEINMSTQDRVAALARITVLTINHFGSKSTPAATVETLHFFDDETKHRCLSIAAMCDDFTRAARALAADAAKAVLAAR
ncbi:MAG: hypothetical protein WA418_25460 [Bradyrhizobium sp.]